MHVCESTVRFVIVAFFWFAADSDCWSIPQLPFSLPCTSNQAWPKIVQQFCLFPTALLGLPYIYEGRHGVLPGPIPTASSLLPSPFRWHGSRRVYRTWDPLSCVTFERSIRRPHVASPINIQGHKWEKLCRYRDVSSSTITPSTRATARRRYCLWTTDVRDAWKNHDTTVVDYCKTDDAQQITRVSKGEKIVRNAL